MISDTFGRNLRAYRDGDLKPGLRFTLKTWKGYYEITSIDEYGLKAVCVDMKGRREELSGYLDLNDFGPGKAHGYLVWDYAPEYEYVPSQEGDREDDI